MKYLSLPVRPFAFQASARLAALGAITLALIFGSQVAPASATDDTDVPVEVTFTMLGACSGWDLEGPFVRYNAFIGTTFVGSVGASIACDYVADPRVITSSAPDVLAAIGPAACTNYSVRLNAVNEGDSYVAWVRTDVRFESGAVESQCLFDSDEDEAEGYSGCDSTDMGLAGFGLFADGAVFGTPGPGGSCSEDDLDADGVSNAADNCPATPNTAQDDADNDGFGDACELVVRTVPWLGNPNRPHEVYSGGEILLQGVATLGVTDTPIAITSATWDPGDGSDPVEVDTNEPLSLELGKVYRGKDGKKYTARLTVTSADGQEASDTFAVVVRRKTLDVEANMAIDKGLWFLHKRLSRSVVSEVPVGSIHSNAAPLATTSAAAVAFQRNRHRPGGDTAENPYVHDISRMLRFFEIQLRVQPIAGQLAGDPDTNGNGIGIHGHDGYPNYVSGQMMDALVASGTPNQIALLGPDGVRGRTYRDIVQDMIDYYAWSQLDTVVDAVSNYQRGSWWLYVPEPDDERARPRGLNSIGIWPAIGGIVAERAWGLTTPAFVKDENRLFLRYSQRDDDATPAPHHRHGRPTPPVLSVDGSFGDSGPEDILWQGSATTPAAVLQYVYDGVRNSPYGHDEDSRRFQRGLDFMARYHRVLDNYGGRDPSFESVNFEMLYATTRAYRLGVDGRGRPAPIVLVDDDPYDKVPAWDWFRNDPSHRASERSGPVGVARAVIDAQVKTGPNAGYWGGGEWWHQNLTTAWGVAMLSTHDAPMCASAEPSTSILWPPNHKLVSVRIRSTSSGEPVTIRITSIYQDEVTNGAGDGNTSVDAFGIGTDTARLRAERSGLGNGRVYHVRFTATSQSGVTCAGEVTVGVPRIEAEAPVDGGPRYDSTRPVGSGDDDEHHGCGDRHDHDRDRGHRHNGRGGHHDDDQWRDRRGTSDHEWDRVRGESDHDDDHGRD